MLEELENKYKEATDALDAAEGRAALEAWYRDTLGKKGGIYLLTRNLGALSAEERPAYGRRLNEVKAGLEAAYGEKLALAEDAELQAQIAAGALDVTLPGRKPAEGRVHIITRTLRDLYRVFGDMGFQVYRTRDVETDEMNFELLNFPPHHPAREMQDSFYTTDEGVILRTHTSAGQIRAMRDYYPEPIRVVLPGMCYRNEQVTARSEMQFTQLELLAVGDNITFADLKGTLTEFARRMFGADRQTRFRASYFPFTEPSAEMDISCFLCNGKGCNICKYTGWLEILGCGMVHPTVLRNGGYDPQKYFGFAAGLGPERIAMLKYGIDDIRQFWANDLRFLEQF
ncbi:MAG: phenylalanine--tRNA ligase subunit alpha [Anaerolineae bacterium]|nr:phenylalanine--tRNA ligase subunit alpha [Anaerolineae bacterium]